MHSANRLSNVRRRVARARNKPGVTCAASRHLHMIADTLSADVPNQTILEPDQWALSLYAVIEALWKLRAKEKRA